MGKHELVNKCVAFITKYENELAPPNRDGLLDCDEAASFLSLMLRHRNIHHLIVLGKSDEGSSHAWVIVDGINYDPTNQGFGNGQYEIIERI